MTLNEIQQSFFSRSFEPDAISHWLWGVAAIVALCLIGILIRSYLARRVRYNPFGTVTDERMIRNILRAAFDQRRPFEVQVQTESSQRRPTLRCSPEYLGQMSFTVEVSGLKSLSEKWLHRSVTVFFRIQVNKDFTYHTFSSSIEGIHHPRQGVCHITLRQPETLENRQKRSFLRITPSPEFFLGSALWYAETMPQPAVMADISTWPRPKLLYIPNRMEQFKILDISAGGARLSVPRATVRAYQLQFNSAEQLLLMLDLLDPDQTKRLRYWMLCRIQNVWIEHASRDVHIGMQFLSWGRPKESAVPRQKSLGVEWLRLSSSNEVEPVGNWIMRRHLELFRESPMT